MNTLRLAFNREPFTLDPQRCSDIVSSAAIFLVFKGLTRLGADHKISYDLADSVQISQDLKTYVFHLKDTIWSDGSPITAYDFEKSWKRALNPSFPARALDFFFPIKNAEKAKKGQLSLDEVGIHAKNAKTLIVTLEQANTNFLKYTCFCPLFPIPSHAQTDEKNIGLITSGPFKLSDWKKGDELKFEKNPRYSTVFLDGVHIRIIPESARAFSLYEKGEIDWIGDPLCALPLNHPFQARKTKSVSQISCCAFNTTAFPFQNVNIRKAFTYAINRKKLIEKLHLSDAHPATNLIPVALKRYSKQKIFFQDGNIPLARELFQKGLQELNVNSSQLEISLSFENNDLRFEMAKILQSDWQEAFGIPIKMEPIEFKKLNENMVDRKYCSAIFRWLSEYTDPLNVLFMFKDSENPRNYSGWASKEYKNVLDGYVSTNELEKRKKLLKKAEMLLSENMPLAPICFSHFSYLEKPYLKNVTISPIGTVQFDQAFIDQSLKRTSP